MSYTPDGTARMRFGEPQAAGHFPLDLVGSLALGDIDEALLALAHEIAKIEPDTDHTLEILAVLAAIGAGSTLVPLDALVESLKMLGVPEARAKSALAGACEHDRVIGRPGDATPLILDGERLYPHAAWAHERSVAAWLERRAPLEKIDTSSVIADVVARPTRAGERAVTLNSAQIAAVEAAATGGFTLISGGPGTGKTSIVVAILRALVRLGIAPGEIALAAPTGKANQRLHTSISSALLTVVDPSPEDTALLGALPASSTLHRLLGIGGRRETARWTALHPLPHRAVIVDESSMIDLAMIDALIHAVGPQARLILLGDADQLPSVEAGAVFRDLVLTRSSVRLTESYRMRKDDPAGQRIHRAAQAVNAGESLADAIVTRALPGEIEHHGVELIEAPRPADRHRTLLAWIDRQPVADGTPIRLTGGLPDAVGAVRIEGLLTQLELRRILCVTRTAARPTGAEAINAAVRARLREKGRTNALWSPGDPVLVEQNDYARSLWNGDFGVIVRTQEGDHAPQLSAVFRGGDGALSVFPVEVLRGLISHAWAMTVHKAQGSELMDVLFILPTDPIALMTREIVYTAISRARRSVVIVGPRAVLEVGVSRKLDRRSGLASSGSNAVPE